MDVVVQGYGTIGRATAKILDTAHTDVKVWPHDPPQGRFYEDGCDVLVVCTPCLRGHLDDPGFIRRVHPDHVVVRSTVVPGIFEELRRENPGVKFHHWPEFLTMATAEQDAINPDKFVWGSDLVEPELSSFLNRFLGRHFHRWSDISILTIPETSSIIKLAINTTYAFKVVLHNVIHDVIHEFGGNYNNYTRAVELDKRLTLSHEQIHHKGYRGAGGLCLGKDPIIFKEILGHKEDRKFLQAFMNTNSRLLGKPVEQVVKENWRQ